MSKAIRQRESAASPPRELPTWLALVVLALAVWGVYAQSLDAPWIFDDSISVLQNPSIRSLWPLVGDAAHPGPLRPPIENPTSARPLVNLSLAINYYFGQLDPRGYRAVNVLLHLANALLVWAIVWRTLRLPYFRGRFDSAARWLALAVALLWALHPLVTEAVVYVTQRTELLVVFCYLATLYSSIRFWSAADPSAEKRWLVAATVACIAGAASKEVMVTAPIVVLLYEWTFVSDSLRALLRRSWPLYLGLAASWLMIAALQFNTPRSESAGLSLGIPLVDWWSTQAKFFVMYLKLTAWPAPLVIHYALPHLETFSAMWPYVAVVAAIAAVTLYLLWRRQPAGWLLASAMLILAPTHLVPIATEIAAERRMYLPLAALVALAVIGIYWILARVAASTGALWPRVAVATAALLLAAAYGVGSSRRVATFQDPVALWRENVELQPFNYRAQTNFAAALTSVGKSKDAIEHYRAAVRVNPEFDEGRYQLGLALAAAGQLDEAITELQAVVRRQPNAAKIRNNLGVVLFAAGRLPEAIAEFEKTLEFEPDFADARDNLNRARQASVLPKAPE